ncbi:MAG: branched-chain amino acid ABC transporter permease, partial [Desulfobacterales bacterium]
MDIFLQLLVSGFAVGGVYALIALGFVLIYKATSIINFATGEFMMIGAYFFYTFMVFLGLPAIPAFIGVMACAALLGFLVERLVLRHMLGQPTISIVMVTIGLSSILMGIAEM